MLENDVFPFFQNSELAKFIFVSDVFSSSNAVLAVAVLAVAVLAVAVLGGINRFQL